MSAQTPELEPGTDIDADDLDLAEPLELVATSDPEQMVDGDTDLGGVGGPDAGGAG